MSLKFTNASISGLKPDPARKEYLQFDTEVPSLGVRVSSSGRRTFVFQRRAKDGRSFRKVLGRFGDLTVAQARDLARIEAAAMVNTLDPFAKRDEEKEQLRLKKVAKAFTLATLIDDWEADMRDQCRPTALNCTASSLRRGFAGLLAKPVESLTVEMVSKAISQVRATSAQRRGVETRAKGASAAHACAIRFKALFSWALRNGRIAVNPFKNFAAPKAGKPRDRFLEADEVLRVYAAAETLPRPKGAYVRFLLATLVRRNEALGLRWSEIKDGVWTIPGDRMKQGKPHEVTLSEAAMSALADLPHHNGYDLVFTRDGRRVLGSMSAIKNAVDAALQADGGPEIEHWTFHDFRRTGVTWMAKAGVSVTIADKLLAHSRSSLSSVAQIYQKHNFAEECADALERWGRFLSGKSAKVISMKGKAKKGAAA